MQRSFTSVICFFLVLCSAAVQAQPVSQTFSTAGSFTFTAPPCVTTIQVQTWGAGGGGGSSISHPANDAGGGGGGGGYTFAASVTVVPGSNYTVIVGKGGNGGDGSSSSIENGQGGGSSSFNGQYVAQGGTGGQCYDNFFSAGNGAGGTGGAGGTYNGGNGASGSHPDSGGGGGGGAGSGGNGGNAGIGTNGTPGSGGTGAQPGGAGGAGVNTGTSNPGVAPGGGGGGANTTNFITGQYYNGGSGADGQVIITYNMPAQPTITSVTGAGCIGSTITITGTGLSGATSVTIGSTAVTNLTIGATTITGAIAAGSTTGTVTVVTPCGNATSAQQFTVGAASAPVNLGTVSICQGSSYSFGGQTYTSAGTYSTTVPSTVTGCDSVTTVTVAVTPALTGSISQSICGGGSYNFHGNNLSSTGTYTDTLHGAGTGGCDSIVTLHLTVVPALTSTLHDSICQGGAYTFNGHSYSVAGSYADTLQGAGTGGCDSIVTLILGIKSGSASNVNISSAVSIFCPNDSTQICADSGFVSYSWNTGDHMRCLYTNSAGNYYVTATDVNGCTVESNHLTINTYSTPAVSISVTGDTLRASGGNNYQWYFNNQLIPNATSSQYIATQSGNYIVELVDEHGCHTRSSAATITTGVSDLKDIGISVYPNPTSTGAAWNVSIPETLIGSHYKLFDINGRIITDGYLTSLKTEVGNGQLPAGLYHLQIETTQLVWQGKLVKW